MKVENFSKENQDFYDRYFEFFDMQGWIQDNRDELTPIEERDYGFYWGYFVGCHEAYNNAKKEMERCFDVIKKIYEAHHNEIQTSEEES